MKTIPSLFVPMCLALSVAWLAVEPASAGEPAKTTAAQAADQVSRRGTADAANAAAHDATDKQAAPADASSPAHQATGKDDTAVSGGKVPSPADVAKSPAAKGTPQRFTPSEQVRPDFDVSFPIDI